MSDKKKWWNDHNTSMYYNQLLQFVIMIRQCP